MQTPEIQKDFRYNFIVGTLDGAFFGIGVIGFAAPFVLQLFISKLTDSTTLIGYIGYLHTIGWLVPQLFMVNHTTRLRLYKPTVLWMTVQERWPFLALALIAWVMPGMDRGLALVIAYVLIVWAAIGSGLTGTPWQSMIGKIMPENRRGTFWGVQSAVANLTGSLGAVAAGFLLQVLPFPLNFTICFLITVVAVTISWAFLASTREPEAPVLPENHARAGWRDFAAILRRDSDFRWFLVVRMLSQGAYMAVAFYVVYGSRHFGVSEEALGLMAGSLTLIQTLSSPLLGWIGDRWGHRRVYMLGMLALTVSALLAWAAPEPNWLYLAFGLAGVANSVLWTIAMSLTLDFAPENERPAYIGLANTPIAPAAILFPLVGGWLSDTFGFGATFLVAAAFGLITAAVLQFIVREPRRKPAPTDTQPVMATSA